MSSPQSVTLKIIETVPEAIVPDLIDRIDVEPHPTCIKLRFMEPRKGGPAYGTEIILTRLTARSLGQVLAGIVA